MSTSSTFRWTRYATRACLSSALLSLCLGGCRGGPPDTVDTAPLSPCDEGAPEGCVAQEGDTCFWDAIPERHSGLTVLTDAIIRTGTEGTATCGIHAFIVCDDQRFVAEIDADEDGGVSGGVPWVHGGEGILSSAFEADSRQKVAVGVLAQRDGPTPCPRRWYGERAAVVCLDELVALMVERYGSCVASAGACDHCVCRYNEITEVQNPECASSSE